MKATQGGIQLSGSPGEAELPGKDVQFVADVGTIPRREIEWDMDKADFMPPGQDRAPLLYHVQIQK